MKKKRGISLIVLVITIIIIIILAGTAIISLINANTLNNATKSNFYTKVDTYSSDLLLNIASKQLDDTSVVVNVRDEDYYGKDVKKVIPSLEKKDYDKFRVIDGRLWFYGDEDENVWAEELGILDSVLDCEYILTNTEDKATLKIKVKEHKYKKYTDYTYEIANGEKITSKDSEHTFEGLYTGTVYILKVTAKREDGIIETAIKRIVTGGKEDTLDIVVSPISWENESVSVYVENLNLPVGYRFEYRYFTDTDYTEYTKPIIQAYNTSIIFRGYNEETNDEILPTTVKIDNIDKLRPNNPTVTLENSTSTSFVINVSGSDLDATKEDGKSGIDKYILYVNGKEVQTIVRPQEQVEELTSVQFIVENLDVGKQYDCIVVAEDKAGNLSSNIDNVDIINPSEEDIDLKVTTKPVEVGVIVKYPDGEASNEYKTKAEVTIRLIDAAMPDNYVLQYTEDGTNWKEIANNGSIEVQKNGEIWARLYKNYNGVEDITQPIFIGKVEAIDNLSPNSVNLSIENITTTGFTLVAVAEDAEETTTSKKSGIGKYNFYIDGKLVQSSASKKCLVTGKKMGQSYSCYVIAEDKVGNSSSSLEISSTTLTTNPSITFDHEESKYTNDNVVATVQISSLPTGYIIQVSQDGISWTDVSGTKTEVTIYGNGTTVYAKLYNKTLNDETVAVTKTFTKMDKLNPNVPTVSITNVSTTSFVINATSTDKSAGTHSVTVNGSTIIGNSVSSGIAYYKYYVNGSQYGSNTTSTTCSVTGRSVGTTYSYYVVAVDNAGNETPSATTNVKTLSQYTVTYNLSGGTGTFGNQTKTEGSTLTLHSGVPSRTGYTFGGWKSSSDSVVYQASGKYTKNATTTMTAQWTPITYKVVYNGNGNTSGTTATSTHTYDKAENLTSNGFKKEYTVTYNHNYSGSQNLDKKAIYSFAGWATSTTGSVVHTNGKSVTNLASTQDAKVNLYAKWTPNSTIYVPTRSGYSFQGWYTDSACTKSATGTNGVYTAITNITLYAKWQLIHEHTASCYHSHTGNTSTGGGCYTTVNYHKHTGSSLSGTGCYTSPNYRYHSHSGSSSSGGGCYTKANYHSHSGSSSSGGGCYTKANYHSHSNSCYTSVNTTFTPTSSKCSKSSSGYHQAQGCNIVINETTTVHSRCSACGANLGGYVKNLTCGKTTSTVESYSLNCGKSTSTVESYGLGCNKSTSTIEGVSSYSLGCGKSTSSIESYSLNCNISTTTPLCGY